jgi:SRSO17 transposase
MLTETTGYQEEMIDAFGISGIKAEEITSLLDDYMGRYQHCFLNHSQQKYFRIFQRGLLSDLDRKTIEPIALTFLGEKEVRGFQQFFRRSTLPDDRLLEQYQTTLSESIASEDGFLCVDGSDFAKKGTHSVGVARQHCGRLGKTENCQAGVFVSYASGKGYGLVDRRLYLPKGWFSEEARAKREQCKVSEDIAFQTKNEIASGLIRQTVGNGKFPVKWVGCDAAFGCDHGFLKSLPDSVQYFACVRENELIFMERPEMLVPETPSSRQGRRFMHPRPSIQPTPVSNVTLDPSILWQKRTLGEGAKGPICADVKCIRCVSCESSTQYGNYVAPGEDIWLYIRKYEDGSVKYFISNAPAETVLSTLDRLATMRWSIEQCFQECKSYLGMTHYETRTYASWHRHMLMVMIAHLFTLLLRLRFKKTLYHDADGKISDFRCAENLA